MTKNQIENHFDKVAASYDSGKRKYSYYYNNLKKLLLNLIGKNKSILEIGCGTGDLLASLNPKFGYGMDISSQMIKKCKSKFKFKKNLNFSNKFSSAYRSLDAIFMSDVIEHLEDPKKEFSKIAGLMDLKTIFIITMANPIWEPFLLSWEKMGWKMKEGPHYRIGNNELGTMLKKVGMRIIKHDYKLLIPIKIPIVTDFVNSYLEQYFKKFAFIEYFVFKKK